MFNFFKNKQKTIIEKVEVEKIKYINSKKPISELTEEEAKEILDFVFPDNKYRFFTGLSFEPVLDSDGKQQVTFSGFRPIVGILYHDGRDNCILHFDNTMVVLWLYQHDYDITEQLITNQDLSTMERKFDYMVSDIMSYLKEPDIDKCKMYIEKCISHYYIEE